MKELRKIAVRLTKEQLATIKNIVFNKVNFFEYISKRTEVDSSSSTTVAVVCEFHDTKTFDAARLCKRVGQKGEYWLYFCNNPTCSVHGQGLNIIKYHKAVLEKETGEEISLEMAMLDLYLNELNMPVPEVIIDEKQEEIDKEAQKKIYMEDLVRSYVTAIAHAQLKESPEAQKYLIEERGFSQYLLDAFWVGYLPSNFKLSEILLSKGFPKELLTEMGIISEKTGNDTLFDRVVMPMFGESEDPMHPEFDFRKAKIKNLYTRTVHIKNDKDKAYKHRYLGKELPFYNIQSCRGKKNIILVEGIADCLSVYDALIKMRVIENKAETEWLYKPSETGVVATYGTNGLSEENMKKYLGSFSNILLAADNDDNSAGQVANIKRAKLLKELFPKSNVKIVSWLEKDANDMLKAKRKPEEFWTCVENAILPEYFLVNNIVREMNRDYADEMIKAFKTIDKISPILKNVPTENPLELYKFVQILSKKISVPIDVILFFILGNKKDTLSLIELLTKE